MSEQSKELKFEEEFLNNLVKKYQTPADMYLGSSTDLIKSSTRRLSRDEMDSMFKKHASKYASPKVIDTNIKCHVVYIPPTLARDLLQFSRRGAINPENRNRKVGAKEVKRYTATMNERKWCLTGEPIVFSSDGELLNGHTRLEAGSQSEFGFITVLITGVTDLMSFAHIDVGKLRSRAQVLEMAGVKVDANVLSKVALLAKAYEQTLNPFAFRGTQGTSFSQSEILHYVEQNQELALSVDFVAKLVKKHKHEKLAPPHVYAFAHYLINHKAKSYSGEILTSPDNYLSTIISGIGISSESDTEFKVRNYLYSVMGGSSSYDVICRLSCIFKGWNILNKIPIYKNTVKVARVKNKTRDEDGNLIPMKGAGNINEPFTVPFSKPGKTPLSIRKQANVKVLSK
ncbi:chromosome partitioning protein ParB [Vibrio parahaemolyticus]|uniref:chromosome partitioning protein ParB n=2 Tax=Vibrio parahaemolyticus TaxID=670 RepID=UPI001120D748|nr:chromosome partitioning protein ParB [Vibrio parahaemolyticus]ELA9360323.1 chromosome partitioning protein ParB [Vibrio parahaemolyticus]TOB71736.1 chromosome partitioning protein ParB [Vibrio parahaemolyticus]HCE3462989.1 chromosome partitioning protein ParB [Vibrio parahaemolyticus]